MTAKTVTKTKATIETAKRKTMTLCGHKTYEEATTKETMTKTTTTIPMTTRATYV